MPNPETYKSKLQAMLKELTEARDKPDENIVELDQTRVGRLSRMDALQTQALNDELARRRELQIEQAKSALRRLDSDDFGYCLRCEEDIDPRRLDADPAVTLCVACAGG